MPKKIIIIGAGVAGLAAGCYAQMNGFQSEIFELHDLPGGLCTAWERDNYIFDGCIHYLYGSAPGQPFYQYWAEIGAIQGIEIINHDEFMQVHDGHGQRLIAYCDPDRFEAQLLEISPEDRTPIHALADGVRSFTKFDMSLLLDRPRAMMGLIDWATLGLKMMPFLPSLIRWGPLDAQGFAQKFEHPFLRKAFPHLFAWPEIPMMGALATLAYMHTGNGGFPSGGSLEFVRLIERRYLELGGVIHYKSQVQKILVNTDRVSGVRLYDDTEHFSDYVISAADGRSTIYDLLEGKYVNNALHKTYEPGALPILSQVLVSYGVNRDLSNEPHWTTYLLDEPVTIAGVERSEIGVKHYCFDPSLAPAGKSSVEVMLRSPYGYWQHIYGRKLYDTEQNQVAEQVAEQLEKIYPGISGDIEVTDVATPLSYERYTNNWLGSTTGWLLTKKTMTKMILGMRKTLPGLGNFYQAGQWVEPGGSLPSSALSGRGVIQLICRDERRQFITSTP